MITVVVDLCECGRLEVIIGAPGKRNSLTWKDLDIIPATSAIDSGSEIIQGECTDDAKFNRLRADSP